MRLAFILAFAGFVFVMAGMFIVTMGGPRGGGRSFQEVMFYVGVGLLALSSARGFGVALAAMRARRSSTGALGWAFAILAVALLLVSVAIPPTIGPYVPAASRSISIAQVLVATALASAGTSVLVCLEGARRAVSRH